MPDSEAMKRRVAVIAGCRTAFARAGTELSQMSPVQLGTLAVRELIHRAELDPDVVEQLIFRTVVPPLPAAHAARDVPRASRLPALVTAFSFSRAHRS